MRIVVFLAVLMSASFGVAAQETETPTPTVTLTPTPTETPTPAPWVYSTVPPPPESTDEPGQMTRFDYVVTAGDVLIADLLTWILISGWAMFLFVVLFLGPLWRRK